VADFHTAFAAISGSGYFRDAVLLMDGNGAMLVAYIFAAVGLIVIGHFLSHVALDLRGWCGQISIYILLPLANAFFFVRYLRFIGDERTTQ